MSLLQEAADTIGPLAKKIKDMSPDELYEALLEASIYSAVMGKVLQKGTGLAGKLSCATVGQLMKQLEKGEWYAVCESIAYETNSSIPQVIKEVGETAQANPIIAYEAIGEISSAIKAAENVSYSEWDMPEKGKVINGRYYTKHALERMAPNTPEVRAQLERRAIQKGCLKFRKGHSKELIKYVQPRGIPPSVIENTIKTTQPIQGRTPNTLEYIADNIKVVTNIAGDVITVHQLKGI